MVNIGLPVEELTEANAIDRPIWGSFDGSTNPPVLYPNWFSIQELEQQVLGGQ